MTIVKKREWRATPYALFVVVGHSSRSNLSHTDYNSYSLNHASQLHFIAVNDIQEEKRKQTNNSRIGRHQLSLIVLSLAQCD